MALMCSALYGAAQEGRFLFRDIKLSEEFNGLIITHIEKDNAGLLWFVTTSGLYRYDGNEAIRFDKDSHPAIAYGTITDLHVDQQDNLWIAASDGLTRFDLKNWEMTPIKTDSVGEQGPRKVNVQAVGADADGRIYAGTRNGMLYQVADDSLALIMDISMHLEDRFRLNAIYNVEEPYPGELWLSTEVGKMVRIRMDGSGFAPPEFFGLDEFEGAAINDVYFHASGKCLFNVPQHGLYLLDTHTGSINRLMPDGAEDLARNGLAFFTAFNEDEVLVFTNQADIGKEKLFVYNFQKGATAVQAIPYPEHLKDNHIDWFKNTGGSLLMSLNNHIVQLVPAKRLFTTLLADAVAINSIRSIYKHPGGRLFIGSYKDRFVSIDENTGEKVVEGNQFVYDILHWNADTLLLSTEGDGLLWYEIKRRRLTPLTLRPEQEGGHPPQRYMTTLTRAGRESVWVGTYTGLLLVNPYQKTYRPVRDDLLAQTKIFDVRENGEKWWIATASGLAEWDSRTGSLTYLIDQELIYCITPVGDEFWVGTDGKGVLILNRDGQVRDSISYIDGLTNDVVYSLRAEGQHIIAATQNGLSVIERVGRRIRNYSRLDQLPANEFNHAAAFSQADTVYLGTVNGLVRFSANGAMELENNWLPEQIPIYVTSLTTGQSNNGTQHHYAFPYQNGGDIVIEAGTRYFSIGFGGWGEYARELQYYYRLDNQSDWYRLGSRQEITFVEMPPGDYDLQLTARLPDGQQIGSVLQVPLLVKPAFHQTAGFRVLVMLALVAAVWSIFKYRENMLQKERKMRIKIASDLHDEVGSSLTRIFFQANTLSANQPPEKKEGKQLELIADTSKQALLTMSDMVWSIDSRFDTMKDLVIRMKDYVYRLREELDFDYRFEEVGEVESGKVSQEVRQNLLLIFKEALTNAIKYGDDSGITISLRMVPSIRLEITNQYTEKDRKVADWQGGRGLENMKIRAERIGGMLLLTDENDRFQLTLELPPKRGV